MHKITSVKHPVQEKTTLWVHPLKNDNESQEPIGTALVQENWGFSPIVIFFNDEPIGSFSPVQGVKACGSL